MTPLNAKAPSSRARDAHRIAGARGVREISVILATVLTLTSLTACETGPDEPSPSAPAGSSASAVPQPPSHSVSPSDPLMSAQWWLAAAGIPAAWSLSGGQGVTVAVVDSGVDLHHPDLAANLVPGWDAVDHDDVPQDLNGHGTHVAGIVAAAANEIGTVGAAPQASIMPIRVLDANGAGSDAAIAEGIRWAVDNGADIINLSLGQAGLMGRLSKGGDINKAIREATAAGVIVVAAAGNEGQAGQQYRIGVDAVVVNASDHSGAIAEFSNVGDVRAITAPGVGIYSTSPQAPSTLWPEGTQGFASLDGTSMATPIVSGVLALALSSGMAPQAALDAVFATANPGTGDPLLGAGIVDAGAALGVTAPVALATPVPTATAAPASGPLEPTSPIPPPSGNGSFTLTMTAPRQATLTTAATVECSTAGRSYEAHSASGGNIATTSFDVTGAPYRGAGDILYAGTITVVFEDESYVVPLAGTGKVEDSLAGHLSVETDEVALTIAWTCG